MVQKSLREWDFFFFCWQNSVFFSQIDEKHSNTHGPTTSAKTTAFHPAKIIKFYSKG